MGSMTKVLKEYEKYFKDGYKNALVPEDKIASRLAFGWEIRSDVPICYEDPRGLSLMQKKIGCVRKPVVVEKVKNAKKKKSETND